MGKALVCGALWMGEVQLVDVRGMPVCVKCKGALPEGEGSVTMRSSLEMSMCSDYHTIEPGSLAMRSECMFGTLWTRVRVRVG